MKTPWSFILLMTIGYPALLGIAAAVTLYLTG